MTSMETTKNFFKEYKIFVIVFIVTVIVFWLLYFYYDIKSWHQKNTDIIGERLDEIIQQTALSASHLSGYRPLLSSVELDAGV